MIAIGVVSRFHKFRTTTMSQVARGRMNTHPGATVAQFLV